MSAAILEVLIIDPYAREVREQILRKDELRDIYSAIGKGCTNFEATYPRSLGVQCVYVDGEGLFGGQHAAFGFAHDQDQVFMGRGIVIGTDEGGHSCSCPLTRKQVEECVIWFDIGSIA